MEAYIPELANLAESVAYFWAGELLATVNQEARKGQWITLGNVKTQNESVDGKTVHILAVSGHYSGNHYTDSCENHYSITAYDAMRFTRIGS